MERRGTIRRAIQPERGDPFVACTFETAPPISGKVVNASQSGFGFFIAGNDDAAHTLSPGATRLVTLRADSEALTATVVVIWGVMMNTESGRAYRGGCEFAVMTPEDRLRLDALIERLRGGR